MTAGNSGLSFKYVSSNVSKNALASDHTEKFKIKE